MTDAVIYYESHVTIEPVFSDDPDAAERLALLNDLARKHAFRVAELLLRKRRHASPVRSEDDTFCTGRGRDLCDLRQRMDALVIDLERADFEVWRAKIEAVLYDERRRPRS